MTVARDGSLSRALAEAALGWRWTDMPRDVQRQAVRSLVNFFACALAGFRDPAVTTAARVFTRIGPGGAFTQIGSGMTMSLLHAASLNAMAANVFDFDDTHLPTIAHPTAPVAPVALALSQARRVSGIELLEAITAGIELQCRIALAISPGHYSRGWHITSTCGVFGAAIAAARLLGLDARQTVWAFGSAAVQGAGLVET
ncbi:MAG: MmgE/PrpD family protein, partial [Betaproteobacteria bacterium]|nr:MmgE/PrpD family protein [Betaproteobacteria bacterium]